MLYVGRKGWVLIETKEVAMTNNNNSQNVISETYRDDGTLATRLIKQGLGLYLFQYDRDGQVTFCQELNSSYFKPTDITYNNGCVASITHHDCFGEHRTVTQYNEFGQVTTSIDLNKDDIINFSASGYIRSIVKHVHESHFGRVNEIEELQFNDTGNIVSSSHKVKMVHFGPGQEKWLTTEAKQYYPDGKLSSHITYKQKTKRTGNIFSDTEEDEAASYISSITQYSNTGEVQICAQLGEYDEINFNDNKVACITRRAQKSNGSLEIQSQTTYYASGNICTVTTYQNGKVISSVTYDENGKPQSSAQEGTENYQDIFANTKNAKYEKAAQKVMAKSKMTVAQAAQILGISTNATEAELKKAYRKLCFQWHPDRNPGNEAQATRMMQQINEAYEVMSAHIRSHNQENPQNDQNNNNNWGNPNNNQNTAQKAWEKLQQAIMAYENAKTDYERAKRDEDDAQKKMSDAYWKMHNHRIPETVDFYHKMCKLYDEAKKHSWNAWALMMDAQHYMNRCEFEYKRFTYTHKMAFTSKCYEYQRAA